MINTVRYLHRTFQNYTLNVIKHAFDINYYCMWTTFSDKPIGCTPLPLHQMGVMYCNVIFLRRA
jgi:hypothetical protein